ncbi:hypothetical protein N0V83_000087 [Neocucurbitaria cava]|uniref:Heterokaryon incompatibility domain-containing protein n=1 Tax=Neocucurbitaria cava TaxID=798079 RepID=A0A9W8YI05_9PLEO|nr:hypothetical protein N0V83_000087 [Neocucurbitaria cava]
MLGQPVIMDHLPLPRTPRFGVETIPYILVKDYDGLGFLEYPFRQNWPADGEELKLAATSRPREDLNAFMQGYLWFGLGYEVLGPAFNRQKFTRPSASGQRVLSTSFLPVLGQQWIEAQKRLLPEARKPKAAHFMLCLRRTLQTLQLLDTPPLQGKLDDSQGRAIAALVETLFSLMTQVFGAREINPNSIFGFGPAFSFVQGHYQALLEQSQWCRSEWAGAKSQVSLTANSNYIANLAPPKSNADHRDCTETLCRAYTIDRLTYKTKHAIPGCQCPKIAVDKDRLATILSTGGLPILFLDVTKSEDGTEHESLRVERWTPGVPYVAISHVWADGMGDTEANALPGCQLRKVKRLVEALPLHPLRSGCKGYMPPQSTSTQTGPRLQTQPGPTQIDKLLHNLGTFEVKESPNLRPESIASISHSLRDFLVSSARNKELLDLLARMMVNGMADVEQRTGGDFLPSGSFTEDDESFDRLMSMAAGTISNFRSIFGYVQAIGHNMQFREDVIRLAETVAQLPYRPHRESSNHFIASFQGHCDCQKCMPNGPQFQTNANITTAKSMAFWVDTICCPVGPPNLKTLAIAKMKETYEDAQHVLVMESYLESVNASDLSDLEILVRILHTGWMTRLWTLQEGLLNQSLWFQFADTAIELKAIRWRFNDHCSPMDATLRMDIAMLYDSLVGLRGTEGFLEVPVLGKLLAALRNRSVTVATDEPICIANLLEIDVKDIYEGEQRAPTMEDIWRRIDAIPADILFASCPRLCKPGLRWAPRSFLNAHIPIGAEFGKSRYGTLVTNGLKVTLPSLMLSGPLPNGAYHTHVVCKQSDGTDDIGNEVWYCCVVPPENKTFESRRSNTETDENSTPILLLSDVPKQPGNIPDRPCVSALYSYLDSSLFMQGEAKVESDFVVLLSILRDSESLLTSANRMIQKLGPRRNSIKGDEDFKALAYRYLDEEPVDVGPRSIRHECLGLMVHDYFELFNERGFGIEALLTGNNVGDESTWIVD